MVMRVALTLLLPHSLYDANLGTAANPGVAALTKHRSDIIPPAL